MTTIVRRFGDHPWFRVGAARRRYESCSGFADRRGQMFLRASEAGSMGTVPDS
jgi:hypothetical protein